MNPTELQPLGGWMTRPHPRLAPPEAADQGLLFRALSRFGRRFGRKQIPHVFTVLHQHPKLFWGWLVFASRLMPYGKLPARTRELIILRVAWNNRCRYEWGQHVDVALRSGVTDAEIVSVIDGASGFDGVSDKAIMQACDELHAQGCISDATWALLEECFDQRQVIETTLLVGHYAMLAGFLNTAGIELEPDIEKKLAKFSSRL